METSRQSDGRGRGSIVALSPEGIPKVVYTDFPVCNGAQLEAPANKVLDPRGRIPIRSVRSSCPYRTLTASNSGEI